MGCVSAAPGVPVKLSLPHFSGAQLPFCRHPILPIGAVRAPAGNELLVGPFGDTFGRHGMLGRRLRAGREYRLFWTDVVMGRMGIVVRHGGLLSYWVRQLGGCLAQERNRRGGSGCW